MRERPAEGSRLALLTAGAPAAACSCCPCACPFQPHRLPRSRVVVWVEGERHWPRPAPRSQPPSCALCRPQCAKVGTLAQAQACDDPKGLTRFYYLSQDLKALVFGLISMHFKIKPIP